MENVKLINLAKEASKMAYAPYSNFQVGAALLTRSGQVFTGCNIENSSSGATICAERTAVFKAVSEGVRDIEVIAVVGSSGDFTFPCGICRQVISELAPEAKIVVSNEQGEVKVFKSGDLHPFAFMLADHQIKNSRAEQKAKHDGTKRNLAGDDTTRPGSV